MNEVERLEQELERQQAALESVRAQLRAARAEAARQEREALTRAEAAVGHIVLSHIDNWKAIDWAAFDEWLAARAEDLERTCGREPLTAREALRQMPRARPARPGSRRKGTTQGGVPNEGTQGT